MAFTQRLLTAVKNEITETRLHYQKTHPRCRHLAEIDDQWATEKKYLTQDENWPTSRRK
jgi:hypothetical protein